MSHILKGQTTDQAWAQADSVLVLGSQRVRLRTFAWRDFMPPRSLQGGSDLMVNLQIQSIEDRPLPPSLHVDSVWVRSSEGYWITAPHLEPRPALPNELDLVLRGGPKWVTSQPVDVLVRLRMSGNESRYLQTRRQLIGRTE